VNRETWDKPTQALGLFLRGRTLRTALPTAFVVERSCARSIKGRR
jgi:hypothetical protein